MRRTVSKGGELVRATALLSAMGFPTLASASGVSGRRLSSLLEADPIIVPSADQLILRGNIDVDESVTVRRSTLVVRDAAGKSVFTQERAIISPWSEDRVTIASPTTGFSGPKLPASLPRGAYTAVWTIDGRDSNWAHFIVGPEKPRYLTLEGLKNSPGGACLLVHIYVWEPKPIDFCALMRGVKIVVDGHTEDAAHGCGIGGAPWISGGYGLAVDARGSRLAQPGRHKVWAQYREHRSNELEVDCGKPSTL